MNDDATLIRWYAREGSEEAFTEMVRRHVNLVWGAARRITRDDDLARDVAQTVFVDLARKARSLPADTVLTGWLHRGACHAAANVVRGNLRRAERERLAMNQPAETDDPEALAIEAVLPLVDEALAGLPDADRDAVLLRFFSNRSFAEIGDALGTNDDAAQKRVSRALERLREHFRRRGVAVGGGVVAAALEAAGMQAAPAGLAVTVASGALVGTGGVVGAASFLLLMKSKLALGIVGGVVAVTTLVWQQRNVTRLADENAALRRQMDAVNTAATSSAALNAADTAEMARLRQEHAELLRLRGELSQLRRRNAEISTGDTSRASLKPESPSATYAAIGAATPSAGLERLLSAARSCDSEGVMRFVSWRRDEGVPEEVANQMREPLTRNLTNTFASNVKVRIMNEQAESDTLVRARVEWLDQTGKAGLAELRFALEEGEWKPAFNIERSPSGSFSATVFLPLTPELGPTGQ